MSQKFDAHVKTLDAFLAKESTRTLSPDANPIGVAAVYAALKAAQRERDNT